MCVDIHCTLIPTNTHSRTLLYSQMNMYEHCYAHTHSYTTTLLYSHLYPLDAHSLQFVCVASSAASSLILVPRSFCLL